MADSDGDITVKPLVEPPRGLYHAKHRRTRDPTSVGMPDVQIPSPPFEISEPAGLILPKAGAWCARSCPLSDGGHRRGYSLCILLTQASDLGPGFDNNGNPDKGCGKPVSEKPPILLSWPPAKGDLVWLAGSLLPNLTPIKGLRLRLRATQVYNNTRPRCGCSLLQRKGGDPFLFCAAANKHRPAPRPQVVSGWPPDSASSSRSNLAGPVAAWCLALAHRRRSPCSLAPTEIQSLFAALQKMRCIPAGASGVGFKLPIPRGSITCLPRARINTNISCTTLPTQHF